MNNEAFAAAGVDRQIGYGFDHELPRRPGWADNQAVSVILSTESARVRHSNQVSAVGRRGEVELGIGAQLALAIIIVGVVHRENRKTVGNEFGAAWARLDDIAGFV